MCDELDIDKAVDSSAEKSDVDGVDEDVEVSSLRRMTQKMSLLN